MTNGGGNFRATATYLYITELLIILILPTLVLYLTGFSLEPLSLPLFWFFIVFLSCLAGIVVANMAIRSRLVSDADGYEKEKMIGRYQTRALVGIMISLVMILILLIFLLPLDNSWVEQYLVDKDSVDVTMGDMVPINFTSTPTDIVDIKLEVKSSEGLDYYLLYTRDGESITPNNYSALQKNITYALNRTIFEVTLNEEDEFTTYTVLSINPLNYTVRLDTKLIIDIDQVFTILLLIFSIVFLLLSGGWYGYLSQRIKTISREERPVEEAIFTPPIPQSPLPSPKPTRIKCPRCGEYFDILKTPGPMNIKCPACGKEGTIGRPLPPPPPTPSIRPAPVAFPVLSGVPVAQVVPPTPPIAKPLTSHSPQPSPQPPPLPPPTVKNIRCPQCKNTFSITEAKRPLNIQCPNCGKTGTLR